MSVKFNRGLKTLVHDLEARGYQVRTAAMIAGSPGRTADIFLENGVVVQWDAYSQTVWTNGPGKVARRAERYLRLLYEGGLPGRLWVFGLWQLRRMMGFLGSLLRRGKRVLSQQVVPAKVPLSVPVQAVKTTATARLRQAAPYSII